MGRMARRAAGILLAVALLLPQLLAGSPPALAEGARGTDGAAFSVVTDDGQLVFLRSDDELADGEHQSVTDIAGTTWEGTVYAGLEELVIPDMTSAPWLPEWRGITSFRVADGCLVRPASCAYLLANLHNLASADLSGLDTGGVTDMHDMFRFDGQLASVDLSPLDTSQVTDFDRMFYHCAALTSLDASVLDTSSATSMREMFAFCTSLQALNVAGWDTSRATDMAYLFSNCTQLEALDLASFDTSSATDMGSMFSDLEQLRKVVLSENFSFRGAGTDGIGKMALLPTPSNANPYEGTWCLAGDVTTAVTPRELRDGYDGPSMAGAWVWTVRGTWQVNYDLAGGSIPDGTSYAGSYTAGDTLALPGSGGSAGPAPIREGFEFAGWVDEQGEAITEISAHSSGERTVTATWTGASAATWPDLEGEAYACYDPQWHYLTLLRTTDTVADGEQQTVTDINGRSYTGIMWGGVETSHYASSDEVPWHKTDDVWVRRFEVAPSTTIRPASCAWWLGCVSSNITYVGLSGLDTSRCTSMASMFRGCSNLYSLDVSGLDTSQVTDMSAMFASCAYITSLDLSGFDTSSVTTMGEHSLTGGMLYGCSRLRTLDITGWDTSSVMDMSGLFGGCYRLASISTADLDTGSVTDMRGMLASCSALTTLDLSGLDTSHVTNMASLLYRCSGLTAVDVSGLDTSQVTDMSQMFAECKALTSLDLTPFETGNVTTMKQMFWQCTSLEELDISSFDTHAVTDFSNCFYQDGALERVTLGADLACSGAGITSASRRMCLPSPPSDDVHTGRWCREDDPELNYLASTLRDTYDGQTMAGAYVWATYLSYPLTLDLAGGSAPEGEEYPTSYVATRVLRLPGIEGSGLSYPVREGYDFVGWLDEGGSVSYRIEEDSRGERTFTASWRPNQLQIRVPVSATLVATQQDDGSIALVPEEGDFELCVENLGNANVKAYPVVTASEGFEIPRSSENLGDGQAEIWFTPVVTGSDPTAEGYDPAADEGYEELPQVLLSQCWQQNFTSLGTPIEPGGRVWLNALGGRMGGWSTGDGSKVPLATISWNVEQALG